VLLAEMLGWCDPDMVQAVWGESYFDPAEMQQDTPRYRTLMAALERRWGSHVARLFERAWRSDSLLDCPTFGEWLVALPLTPSPQPPSPLPQAGEGKGVAAQPPGEEVRAAVEATAEIRAFMQAARRMENKGDLDSALKLYRQALELAGADPSLRSLAREIELTVQDVEKRVAAQAPRPQPAIPPLPSGEGAGVRAEGPGVRAVSHLPPGEGEGVREQPRRKPGWGFWLLWVLVNILGMFVVNHLLFRVTRGSIRISYGIRTIVGRGIVGWWSSGLPLVGIAIGIAQWIVLHSYVGKKSWWWILTTISGWVAGLFFLGMLPHYMIWSMEPVIAQALGGAAIGIFLGLAQWLFLRRQLTRSGLWVLVNVVSWALVFASFAIESTLVSPSMWSYYGVVEVILGNIVVGAIIGATQWLTLRNRIPNARWLVPANALGWVGNALEWVGINGILSCISASNFFAGVMFGGVMTEGMAYEVGGLIGLFVIGTVIGLAQWLVFRHHFKRAGWWWILVTALGWTVGYFVSWSLLEAIGWTTFERFEAGTTTALVMSGTIAGIFQWLLLRQEVPKAGWWIIANLAGWIGSIAAIAILKGEVSLGLAFVKGFEYGWVRIIFPYAVMPHDLLPGLLTGAVLVWLLRQPRPETKGDAQ